MNQKISLQGGKRGGRKEIQDRVGLRVRGVAEICTEMRGCGDAEVGGGEMRIHPGPIGIAGGYIE